MAETVTTKNAQKRRNHMTRTRGKSGALEPPRCRKMEIEEQVNDRWLLSFNENLEKVEATQGFVIQIQQGVQREKSFMQIAEEKMARWLKVPRIGIYSLETEKVVFPPDHFQTAKEKAQEQWAKKEIGPEVVMCSEIFEPLVEGQKLPVDKDGAITGKARGVDANGAVYEGDFVRHKREGRGKYTWPNGDTYEGEFAHHKIHGRGMYRYASGDVEVGSYEADEDTGVGVKRLADGSYWQLDAGKVVKKISEEEAKRLVKQHTLPSLW